MSAPGSSPPTRLERRKRGIPRLALSISEACEALGVSHAYWQENVVGEIRIVRKGRRKLIALVELERWLDQNAERTLERRS